MLPILMLQWIPAQGSQFQEMSTCVLHAGDAQNTYLLDNLSSWESFAGHSGKHVRIFPVPPRLISVAVWPFMLDAALTGIQQPKLDHRIKKAEKASTFSRIFGGWR